MAKYCPEIVDDICTTIAAGSDIKSACKAAGISKNTFFEWMKDPNKADFHDRIAKAQAEFRRCCPDELIRLAKQRLADALQPKRTTTRRISTTSITKHFDAEGNLKGYSTTAEDRELVETLPVAVWAINRVLPDGPSLDQLAQIAEKYGLTLSITDPELFWQHCPHPEQLEAAGIKIGRKESRDSSRGLSPETVAEIRARVMGLPAASDDGDETESPTRAMYGSGDEFDEPDQL